jgi:glucosamine--fructose-6-phosphate aminotransferase (isomerizing)
MCGIVAYIGQKDAFPFLINGLRRLEYRGYDSAGIAILNHGLKVYKKKGKVNDLEEHIKEKDNKTDGNIGIGHTRWATHGKPSDINAHPHLSQGSRLAIVHNGIIENHQSIKDALTKVGHTFKSETDTEVLVHLIEEYQKTENLSLAEAVRSALNKVRGAYAIVVMDKDDPNTLVAARKASPLVLGVGNGDFYIASDATPLVGYTSQVIYLGDEEICEVKRDGTYNISSLDNETKDHPIHELDLELEELQKGGYDHFMLKEIFQQPGTIADCMRGRINAEEGWIRLGGLEEHATKIANADRFIILGCGTSWHAGMIGEYLFEELARIPTEVEYASEFRYRNPIITEEDVIIALSQSGETADTMAALELAKHRGALTYGIVNVVGSTIARFTDAGSYIHAGPEIGVASTKAFTGQLTLLAMMALSLGQKRGKISSSYYFSLLAALESVPEKVEQILKQSEAIEYIAQEIYESSNALYLGRGANFPVALEGALKLKEISYIHAEGYPAAEMKHGPIALIDENMPVIVIATNQSAYDKISSNVQEVKARKGRVIAIVKEGDEEIKNMADYCIEVPHVEEPLAPLISVIPLQLLSYYIAVLRGCNVDQPRNLAKSVTVE